MRLLCTVRSCRSPLERRERTYVCANNHSFDVARSGYVNLLQPQDRKSRSPGDTAEAVAARRRWYERGDPLVSQLVRAFRVDGALLDVGCRDGHHLAAFHAATSYSGLIRCFWSTENSADGGAARNAGAVSTFATCRRSS